MISQYNLYLPWPIQWCDTITKLTLESAIKGRYYGFNVFIKPRRETRAHSVSERREYKKSCHFNRE